jgi:hypothetical protein
MRDRQPAGCPSRVDRSTYESEASTTAEGAEAGRTLLAHEITVGERTTLEVAPPQRTPLRIAEFLRRCCRILLAEECLTSRKLGLVAKIPILS